MEWNAGSALHKQLPGHFLQISVGGGGDCLCFDHSENPLSPKVVFYFHEPDAPEAISYVADSFTDVLGMLKEDR
ncbi:hypothetical protein BLX41_08415 [Pseudomonas protegens]|nr:hypothetical protein BLX41_08415 [Pseudomonas protegens]